MKVKICGLTNPEDAFAALELGADLLGFNFYPSSPRYIQPDRCARIIADLRSRYPAAVLVGIFVNSGVAEITAILDQCGLDLAQLSGDEPPAVQIKLGPRAYKAIRPSNSYALQSALGIYPIRQLPPACLVDAYRPGEFGGTGQLADWSLASGLSARYPILLAGGLTPQNVAGAVAQVKPWGVDVASGVESQPGQKGHSKMETFIKLAKQAG